VSVIGRDQKGVVARVSTYLASCDINIEDIEQRVMEGLFIMTMLVDVSEATTTLDELVLGLRRIGDEIGMETTLRLAGAPTARKRVAVLVTKEPHCLAQLVHDRDAGLLRGDLVLVLGNHPDLEPLAREHGIPFAWAALDGQDGARGLPPGSPRRGEARPRRARALHADPDAAPDRPLPLPHHQHPPLAAAVPSGLERVQAGVGGGSCASRACTAHFVTEQLDAGPVILQDVFHIRVGEDTLDEVKERGRDLEGHVLSQAVQLCLNDQLVVKDKKVIFRPGVSPAQSGGSAMSMQGFTVWVTGTGRARRRRRGGDPGGGAHGPASW
jgi:formyltetrahydrofolate deformylase